MDEFLNELKQILEKYNAAIVRSANSSNDLMITMQTAPGQFDELIFAEEITEVSIRNEWYS